MKPTLLIDADVLVYKFAFGESAEFDWGDDVVSTVTNADKAFEGVRMYVDWLMTKLSGGRAVMCLSDSGANFRKELYPEYKANRSAKPELYGPIREFIATCADWTPFMRPRLEADDVMGILSTAGKPYPGQKIICSVDKDMKTIPGFLFNPNKHEDGVVSVKPLDADRYHLFQTLTGDSTDNYKGCPGVGKVKAARLVNSVEADPVEYVKYAWPIVVDAFAGKGLAEDDALLQARLARILRVTDYDFSNKEVKLWKPT